MSCQLFLYRNLFLSAFPIADEPLIEHVLSLGETVHIEDILDEEDPMFTPTRARCARPLMHKYSRGYRA
jgi:hypothetical protein